MVCGGLVDHARSGEITNNVHLPATCSAEYRSIVYVLSAIDIKRHCCITQRAYPNPETKVDLYSVGHHGRTTQWHIGGHSHVWKVFGYFKPVSVTAVPETLAIQTSTALFHPWLGCWRSLKPYGQLQIDRGDKQ